MNRATDLSTRVAGDATPVERIYFAWDEALSRNDKAALLALYATDAVIESPLIHMSLKQSGVSSAAMRKFSTCWTRSRPASRRCGDSTAPAI